MPGGLARFTAVWGVEVVVAKHECVVIDIQVGYTRCGGTRDTGHRAVSPSAGSNYRNTGKPIHTALTWLSGGGYNYMKSC